MRFLILVLINLYIIFNNQPVVGQEVVDLSIAMLESTKSNESPKQYFEKLAEIDESSLANQLTSDDIKLTFWVNLYNATVQYFLVNDPSLFDDRGSFFSTKRITVAGQSMSLDDIEHGMIRRSKIKLSLGLMGKWNVSKFEKKFRMGKVDPRIHFALNCGAKSCPPVAIYNVARVRNQLELSSKMYLTKSSIFDAEAKKVRVTKLFSWFRGDFGSKKDIKKMLLKYGIIPDTKNIDIDYLDYDWTLLTGNYIEL